MRFGTCDHSKAYINIISSIKKKKYLSVDSPDWSLIRDGTKRNLIWCVKQNRPHNLPSLSLQCNRKQEPTEDRDSFLRSDIFFSRI